MAVAPDVITSFACSRFSPSRSLATNGMFTDPVTGTIFSGGDWDVAWVALNVNAPDQLVPFLSGTKAPDGTNFAGIENADYQAGLAEAAKTQGVEGCDAWLAAESTLLEDADVVPFANNIVRTFGAGAEFATPGNLVPTSIRMMKK